MDRQRWSNSIYSEDYLYYYIIYYYMFIYLYIWMVKQILATQGVTSAPVAAAQFLDLTVNKHDPEVMFL